MSAEDKVNDLISRYQAVQVENELLRQRVAELEQFAEEVRRAGDTRLASMAIAVLNMKGQSPPTNCWLS